jgi:hypothetical protein
VNAPGSENTTTVLPLKMSSVVTLRHSLFDAGAERHLRDALSFTD